jgi:hypothetical protein
VQLYSKSNNFKTKETTITKKLFYNTNSRTTYSF